MANNPGPKETIQARRRRQGASSGPSSTGRAEIPPRRQTGGSGPRPPSGGGGSGGTGGLGGGGGLGGLGGGGARLPIWLVLLVVVGYAIFNMFTGGGDSESTSPPDVSQPDTSGQQQATLPARPTSTPRPTRTPAPAGAATGQKWTVMLYQDADDKILEQDIYIDLNEVERIGSSDQVQIVAQFDRYKGAYSGDGDWTSTRRYFITQDDDLQSVHSELVDDLGEANMADGGTLVDFITWSAQNYPADKYVLILSDHGMGWPGGWSDPDPASRDSSRAPLASALGEDQLYLMELGEALSAGLSQANIDKFELIGMDACLMGHIEVISALEPYGRYAVLSQETEPALGWAYASFLQTLESNPDMTGAELGAEIVRSYITDDQRINDDQMRAEFLRQGSPLGGLFGSASQMSAAALAQQLEHSITLTAVDLSGVPALVDSLNGLAYNLQNEDQSAVANARNYAPSYTNIFAKDIPSPYIDLGSFLQLLQRGGLSAETGQAVNDVTANIQNMVVAEKHGPGKRGSTGISIYFPNSTLYRSPVAGPQSYTAIAERFSDMSLWDDFLRYHYTDINFEAQPAPATRQQEPVTRAPGMGQIEIAPITLSSNTAAPGDPVTVSTTINGNNIGYIYLFVSFFDQTGNAIYQADTDYLESPNTQEINGVFYPQWSEDEAFNLTFEWEPTLFQITDGQNTSVALFNPETYGAAAEDAVYTIDGTYHYADGESRSARLYFRDGVLRQVFGFTDANHTGGAREIIPQTGDSFTILDKWLDLDSSGQVTQTSTQDGVTLTFGSQPFTWEEVYAPAGQYVIGIIVKDLDGNAQEAYTTITVQ